MSFGLLLVSFFLFLSYLIDTNYFFRCYQCIGGLKSVTEGCVEKTGPNDGPNDAIQKAQGGSGEPVLTRFCSNDAVSEFFFLSDRYFIIIYLLLSPTSTFATRDFVAKLDVGPRLGGPVGPQQHL